MMIKITWTMLESLIFQSMKPFYLVTTTSSWLHQRTLTRNQLLVHLKPSDMGCTEKHAYVLPAKKFQRKERRKDIQMQNKRKGFGDGGPFMEVLFGHGGQKTPTLAMVAPLLRQQGNGDQRTEECIFLEGEDTTR